MVACTIFKGNANLKISEDDKINPTACRQAGLNVLFHFCFVAIPIAIGINSLLFADFSPRIKEKQLPNFEGFILTSSLRGYLFILVI